MLEAILSVMGAGLIGVIAWATNMQSRVSVVEANLISFKQLIEAKFDEMGRRLARIESKLEK